MTFRYGIRYDKSVQRTDQDEAFLNYGVWGPRFYATWDPWGDQQTKILGGYGRFNAIGSKVSKNKKVTHKVKKEHVK